MTQPSYTMTGGRRSSTSSLGILVWANAFDFGVRGDGVVDDATSLSQLIDGIAANGGGVVVLPPSVGYRLGQVVSVPATVTVIVSGGVQFTESGLDNAAGGVVLDLSSPPPKSVLIGSFSQAVAWTLPSSDTWTETPVQVTCALTGAPVRLSLNLMLSCPTKGQRVFWDVMLDGVRGSEPALGAFDAPETTYGSMASGTYYAPPPPPSAGTHRISIALYGPSGAQILDVIWATLYVTEER